MGRHTKPKSPYVTLYAPRGYGECTIARGADRKPIGTTGLPSTEDRRNRKVEQSLALPCKNFSLVRAMLRVG